MFVHIYKTTSLRLICHSSSLGRFASSPSWCSFISFPWRVTADEKHSNSLIIFTQNYFGRKKSRVTDSKKIGRSFDVVCYIGSCRKFGFSTFSRAVLCSELSYRNNSDINMTRTSRPLFWKKKSAASRLRATIWRKRSKSVHTAVWARKNLVWIQRAECCSKAENVAHILQKHFCH